MHVSYVCSPALTHKLWTLVVCAWCV